MEQFSLRRGINKVGENNSGVYSSDGLNSLHGLITMYVTDVEGRNQHNFGERERERKIPFLYNFTDLP